METIKQFQKTLFILLALMGMSTSVWANTASSANSGSDIKNGNVVISTQHATFTLDAEKDLGTNGDNGYSVYNNLPKNTTTTLSLTWTVDSLCDVKVTNISFKAKGYTSNALKAGSCELTFNGATKAIGTATLSAGGGFADFAAEGELASGMTIVYENTGGAFPTTFDCYIKNLQITYTVTPKNKPEVVTPEETILVKVDDDQLASNTPQTLTLKEYFTGDDHLAEAYDFAFTENPDDKGSIANGVFSASAVGTYKVHARVAAKADCHEASAWSDDVLTITVEKLDQQLVWVNAEAIQTNMLLGSNQPIAVATTSVLTPTLVSSDPTILSVENGVLTANKVGEATITASVPADDRYNAIEPIALAFTVREKDTPFFLANGFSAEEPCVINVDSVLANAFTFTHAANPVAHIDVVELNSINNGDEQVIEYDAEKNVIIAHNAGKATLYFTQAETAEAYAATSLVYTFTVEKLTNTLYVNGSTEFSASMQIEANYTNLVFTADNEDYTNCPISVVAQTAGEDIAAYAEGAVTSGINLGTATWMIAQPENYKYLSGTGSFSITVAMAPEVQTCEVLNDPELQEWATINRTKEYPISGAAGKLKFQAKRTAILGFTNDDYFFAEYSETAEGDEWNRLQPYIALPESGQWYDIEYDIPEGSKRVRMRTETGAVGNRHIQNVVVTRKTYLRAEDVTINKVVDSETRLYPTAEGKAVLAIDYSLANGEGLKLVWDNPNILFTDEKLTTGEIALGDFTCADGKIEIPVYYTSNVDTTESTNVLVYNPAYRKAFKVTAVVEKLDQEFAWVTETLTYQDSIDNIASSNIDTLVVEYASSDESVILVDGTKLIAVGAGTAMVTAITQGTEFYKEGLSEKLITVAKAAQEIEWDLVVDTLVVGDTLEVSAVATSGLEVTLESSNYEVIDVDDFTLYALTEGEAIISARQDGDDNYLAATQLSRAIVVRPEDATWLWNVSADATKTVKVIRNGQIYIIRGDKTYTAEGQLVK